MWAIVGAVCACSGGSRLEFTVIAGGAGGGSGGAPGEMTGSGGGTSTGAGGDFPIPPPSCREDRTALAPARIWQITDQEYVNIVRDVLGITLTGSDAEVSGAADSTGEFGNFAETGSAFNDMLAQRLQAAAQTVAARAANSTDMARLLGSTSPTMEQVATFVATKAPRLVRRPLTAAEVASLTKIYADAVANPEDGGPTHAFGLILESVLQWPSFLFRTELGSTGTPAKAPIELTPCELAAALSFALTDSAPDDALWAHAENGTLTSPDVLAAQVDRLMTLPIAQTTMAKYLSYWLWIERIPYREKDPVLFPEYTATLQASLYESGFAFLQDVLEKGGLGDLFTSSTIYVNREMSTVYGITGAASATTVEPVATTLPERQGGILTQPALLAATNQRAGLLDPVHHGLFVLSELLGGGDIGDIPAPRPDDLSIAAMMHGTERELAEQRAQTACGACHSNFDGYGLTRSRYDSIGRYSETRYVASDWSLPSQHSWVTSPTPIDESTVIPAAVGVDLSGPLAGTRALSAQLDRNKRVAYAAGKYLTMYVMGYDSTPDDSCGLRDLKEGLYRSQSFKLFFRSLLTSPGFRTRDPSN
jgi:hypothetical protein